MLSRSCYSYWVSWVWLIDLNSWGLGSCLWWLMGTAQESGKCLWAWFYVPWWSVVPHTWWEWSQFGDPWGCWVTNRLAPVVPWQPLWWAYWCVSYGWCLIQTIYITLNYSLYITHYTLFFLYLVLLFSELSFEMHCGGWGRQIIKLSHFSAPLLSGKCFACLDTAKSSFPG